MLLFFLDQPCIDFEEGEEDIFSAVFNVCAIAVTLESFTHSYSNPTSCVCVSGRSPTRYVLTALSILCTKHRLTSCKPTTWFLLSLVRCWQMKLKTFDQTLHLSQTAGCKWPKDPKAKFCFLLFLLVFCEMSAQHWFIAWVKAFLCQNNWLL